MTQETQFIFFGTPEFATAILEKLIDSGFAPKAVVCNPDRPTGRKKVVRPPPVKSLISERGLTGVLVIQPEKLDEDFRLKIAGLNPDFFIVAAYAKIIPRGIIGVPRLGAIGVHPSLLPKYRGSSPIQTSILSGDKETGVTLFLLDEKIDHGEMLSSAKCAISSSDNYETLLRKLSVVAGDLLVETLPKFLAGKIKPFPQDESGATYTSKFASKDAFVEPVLLRKAESEGGAAAVEIDRKIRALNLEPGVWTLQQVQGKQKRVKLLEAEVKDGRLILKKTQIEGEKPQSL